MNHKQEESSNLTHSKFSFYNKNWCFIYNSCLCCIHRKLNKKSKVGFPYSRFFFKIIRFIIDFFKFFHFILFICECFNSSYITYIFSRYLSEFCFYILILFSNFAYFDTEHTCEQNYWKYSAQSYKSQLPRSMKH